MISRNKFSNKSAECVWYWGKPQFSHVLIIIYASSMRLLSSCLVFGLRDCLRYGRRLWRRLSPSDDFLQGNPPACRRIYLMFTITILKVIFISSACSVNHGNKCLMIKNTTRNQTRYVFWTWCWINSKFFGLSSYSVQFLSLPRFLIIVVLVNGVCEFNATSRPNGIFIICACMHCPRGSSFEENHLYSTFHKSI